MEIGNTISKVRRLNMKIADTFPKFNITQITPKKISLLVEGCKYLVKDSSNIYIVNFDIYDKSMPIYCKTFLD